jgi:nucleotide-binding universal stress UspA family protein
MAEPRKTPAEQPTTSASTERAIPQPLAKKELRLLWAIDVFDPAPVLWRHQVDFLEALVNKALQPRPGLRIATPESSAATEISPTLPVRITPLHVLSPEQLELQLEFTQPWLDRFVPAAQKALDSKTAHLPFAHGVLTEGKVLVHAHASTRGAVRALMQFAENERYDCIVVASHGRRGLGRSLLGSFAESLIVHSKIPVLVVGADAVPSPREKFREVLFATDLSTESRRALHELLPFLRLTGAKLRLFHAIVRPLEPVVQSGLLLASGAWVGIPEFLKIEQDRKRDELRQWMEEYQAQGIPCTFDIEESLKTLPERIIEVAREHQAGMIALAGKSGGFSAALLGSIARDIVRGAHCPVWVLHEKEVT